VCIGVVIVIVFITRRENVVSATQNGKKLIKTDYKSSKQKRSVVQKLNGY